MTFILASPDLCKKKKVSVLKAAVNQTKSWPTEVYLLFNQVFGAVGVVGYALPLHLVSLPQLLAFYPKWIWNRHRKSLFATYSLCNGSLLAKIWETVSLDRSRKPIQIGLGPSLLPLTDDGAVETVVKYRYIVKYLPSFMLKLNVLKANVETL